ncbi:hypothetical protein FWF48_00005, partial [Candidatus Saccharibacteria bacterium]|nr:hypothetical protein [Candidatus Saccharibacteria bacterium]
MNDGENPDSGQELGPFGKQAKAAITPDKPDVGQNIGTSGAGGNDKAKAAGSLLNNLEKKATGGGGAGTDSESDIPFKGGGAGAAKQGADLVNAIAKKDPKALLNLAKSGKNGGMMKYAPTAAIGAILIVIVVIVGFVMLALQPIHMVEQIFDKYASGSWTSNLRYNEMLTKKYFGGGQKGATSATNSSNLNTDTVFTTVSQQTIDASKAAGFTLATTPSSTVDGQFVVTSITDDTTGKTMTESDFTDAMNNDASFRDRIYQVYNPRVAIWYDRTAEDFKNRFNLTENNAGLKMPDSSSDSTTDSTATSWVQKLLAAIMPSAKAADDTSTDNPTGEAIAQQSNDGTYQSNQTEQSCAKEDKDKNLIASDCSSSGAKQVGGIISDQVEDAKSKLTDEVNQELLKSIAVSAIGALGPLDAYCTTMSTLDLINTATKEIRAGQLMKYAQIFMATADKIKAGDATADEVSAVMTQINGDAYQQVLDSDGQPTGKTTGPKTGTESAGWQWLVDGTIDSNDPSLAKYHIGTANGKLFDLAQSIASMPEKMANSGKLGEAVKTVCGLMGNPFVRIANVVGGIFTIATIPFKNGPAVAGLMYFMHVAAPMLIQVLAAKTITTDIAGEDSMNALVSGAGMMHARNCEANGCTNLTKSTAGKAYLEYQKYIAQVGDDERYSH